MHSQQPAANSRREKFGDGNWSWYEKKGQLGGHTMGVVPNRAKHAGSLSSFIPAQGEKTASKAEPSLRQFQPRKTLRHRAVTQVSALRGHALFSRAIRDFPTRAFIHSCSLASGHVVSTCSRDKPPLRATFTPARMCIKPPVSWAS